MIHAVAKLMAFLYLCAYASEDALPDSSCYEEAHDATVALQLRGGLETQLLQADSPWCLTKSCGQAIRQCQISSKCCNLAKRCAMKRLKPAEPTPLPTTTSTPTPTPTSTPTPSPSPSGGGDDSLAMPGYIVTGIQATPWAEYSDPGGCSLPGGYNYTSYALALGDMPALGDLAFKNNYCGLILEVDCGTGAVSAVVASVKDHYSYSTGIDLVWNAWDAASLGDGSDGNPSGEYLNCTVTLTDADPISPAASVCAQRPDSIAGASDYYRSVGMFNSYGVPVVSATLAGIEGTFSGDSSYFDFDPSGQPLLTMDADFVATFADGSTITKQLSECGANDTVHIFGS